MTDEEAQQILMLIQELKDKVDSLIEQQKDSNAYSQTG